jgi:holo-[acyl-carrier protein] synthase
MGVLALGLDLVAIERVDRLLARKGERALRRLLTEAERRYCERQAEPTRHIAARLAAKEAAYKAFQSADHARGIGWRELEVTRDANGRPHLVFHGAALVAAGQLSVTTALLSISHTDTHAVAVVVLAS